MVRPGAGQNEHDGGTREGSAVEEGNGIREMGIVDFGEGGRAEVEGLFDGGGELFLGVGFGGLGAFPKLRDVGSGYAGDL